MLTVRSVVARERSIRLVVHASEEDARFVGLAEVVGLDATLAALADLPLGWQASRQGPEEEWHRSEAEAP